MKAYCLIFTLTLLFSCSPNTKIEDEKDIQFKNEESLHLTKESKIIISDSIVSILDSLTFQSSKDYTPISFLKEALIKDGEDNGIVSFFVVTNNFPEDWVKESDVRNLMLLIESTKKCECYLNPLASSIPTGNAELGGYAILFINSFRFKEKIDLGLYCCPKINKKEVEELKTWWENYKLNE